MINSVNYSMPAEWEPHSAVWIAWPHDKISFPRLDKVQKSVTKIICTICQSETVELLVLDRKMEIQAKQALETAGADLSKINFHKTTYVDAWMRDCGGIFVNINEGQRLISFIFNVWGGKFPKLKIDGKIPKKVSQWTGLEMVSPNLVLEGGAIDVNGEGVCLTTEQCLLNKNRNPQKTKADVEKHLQDYLGIKKAIWLKRGLVNDHTDGHIDDIARFVSPTKILCAFEDDEKDENYKVLKRNFENLSQACDLNGKPFEIAKLPMPHMRYNKDKSFEAGEKAPVSYANFYIGNEVVLVPTFNDKNDNTALKIIKSCFPGRKAVGIDCSDVIYGGGTIHCLTQQQPKIDS